MEPRPLLLASVPLQEIIWYIYWKKDFELILTPSGWAIPKARFLPPPPSHKKSTILTPFVVKYPFLSLTFYILPSLHSVFAPLRARYHQAALLPLVFIQALRMSLRPSFVSRKFPPAPTLSATHLKQNTRHCQRRLPCFGNGWKYKTRTLHPKLPPQKTNNTISQWAFIHKWHWLGPARGLPQYLRPYHFSRLLHAHTASLDKWKCCTGPQAATSPLAMLLVPRAFVRLSNE